MYVYIYLYNIHIYTYIYPYHVHLVTLKREFVPELKIEYSSGMVSGGGERWGGGERKASGRQVVGKKRPVWACNEKN